MGCDIHAFIEYRAVRDLSDPTEAEIQEKYGNPWWSFSHGKVSLDRSYTMFGALANVRVWDEGLCLFPTRGMPVDISWETQSSYCYYVKDDDKFTDAMRDSESLYYCKRSNAESWVKNGSSQWWKPERNPGEPCKMITGPDWHSASWLTTAEYESVLRQHAKFHAKWARDSRAEYQRVLRERPQDAWAWRLGRGDKEPEFKASQYRAPATYHAVLAAMKALEKPGRNDIRNEARLVFFFDN